MKTPDHFGKPPVRDPTFNTIYVEYQRTLKLFEQNILSAFNMS